MEPPFESRNGIFPAFWKVPSCHLSVNNAPSLPPSLSHSMVNRTVKVAKGKAYSLPAEWPADKPIQQRKKGIFSCGDVAM